MPSPALVRRALGALLATLVVLVAQGAGGAPPAQAHPFGDPQTVALSLTAPDVVRVTWRVGMQDDLTYLAQDLDLLPTGRVMLDGAVDPEAGDPALLERSPRLDAYLLQHLAVRSGGRTCRGALVRKADLLEDGATLDFTCPDAVTSAEVAVSTLTDLSPLYTTLATGPQDERAVYDGTHPEHTWAFAGTAASASPGRSAALQLGLGGGGVAGLALAVGLLYVRRRGRAA